MSNKCFAACYYFYDKKDNGKLKITMRQLWANSEEEAIGLLVTKDPTPPADAKAILFTEFTEEMAKRVLIGDRDPLLSLAEDAVKENE